MSAFVLKLIKPICSFLSYHQHMLSLGFVGPREDLVFFGKTGRGKTHMAVALAMRTAAAIWSSPNTAPHRLNSRFVVMTTDCRS